MGQIPMGPKTLNRQTEDLSTKAHLGPPKDGKFHFIFMLFNSTLYLHRQLIRGVIILSPCIYLFLFLFYLNELLIIVQASWHWQMAIPTTCTKLFWNCQPSTYFPPLQKYQYYIKNFVYYKSTLKWICYVKKMRFNVVSASLNSLNYECAIQQKNILFTNKNSAGASKLKISFKWVIGKGRGFV